jgi:nicotinamide-nucleotide amidase
MKRVIKYFGTEEELREKLCSVDSGFFDAAIINSFLDNEVCLEVTDEKYHEICDVLGDELYGEDGAKLEKVLVDFLAGNGLALATAESCTGGMIASRIVDVPGASKVFFEGLVTYSNESKMQRLAVNCETLEKYGAVSEQTAKEMAYGLLNENVDIAVSTTGIAGPDGGTPEKPVGLVYIGMAFQTRDPIAVECRFSGDRNAVRRQAANTALYRVYSYLYNTL